MCILPRDHPLHRSCGRASRDHALARSAGLLGHVHAGRQPGEKQRYKNRNQRLQAPRWAGRASAELNNMAPSPFSDATICAWARREATRKVGKCPPRLHLTRMIEWNEECSHLCFHEAARKDAEFSQSGSVSFPHISGHVYLVTDEAGQYRLALLGRPTISGR